MACCQSLLDFKTRWTKARLWFLQLNTSVAALLETELYDLISPWPLSMSALYDAISEALESIRIQDVVEAMERALIATPFLTFLNTPILEQKDKTSKKNKQKNTQKNDNEKNDNQVDKMEEMHMDIGSFFEDDDGFVVVDTDARDKDIMVATDARDKDNDEDNDDEDMEEGVWTYLSPQNSLVVQRWKRSQRLFKLSFTVLLKSFNTCVFTRFIPSWYHVSKIELHAAVTVWFNTNRNSPVCDILVNEIRRILKDTSYLFYLTRPVPICN